MSEDRWISVTNQRKKRYIRSNSSEKEKWDNLKKDYPHILMPNRAFRINKKLNVDGLYDRLISEEWINHQKQGWIYVKVLKDGLHNSLDKDIDEKEYSILPLNNGWNDKVLFFRI